MRKGTVLINENKMLNYLLELRQRCLRILILFGVFFVVFFYYAHPLFEWILKPLLVALPDKQGLIAMQITAPLFTPIKVAGDFALVITLPFALGQIWAYVVPALYRQERRKLSFFIGASFVLFCCGLIFCYCLILPWMFNFFVAAVPPQVKMMPDMAYALDFTTRMLVIFGLCFQLPLVCWALVSFGYMTVDSLVLFRPYVIVAAFIVGMLLTPPDVLSQILLAIPLCFLYELGILFCRFSSYVAKKSEMPQTQLK